MAEKTLVYQLWPYAWGSIRMMTLMLGRIVALGADYVWLSPVFASPGKNHGYDVSDYYSINDKLGTMADFDEFVASAHAMGLKVILDLPIDSTSTEHNWFKTETGMYIKNSKGDPTKLNMSHGPAWRSDGKGGYYLSLNHPAQATLNWFSGGVLNRGLLEQFRSIMCFWLCGHNVDGFRLENVQLLNDDLLGETKLNNFLTGMKSVRVINELSNLYTDKSPFLVLDLIDPDCGSVCDFYAHETDIEFITNRVLKSTVVRSKSALEGLKRKVLRQAENRKFMLDLENHDSPRFTSRSGLSPKKILEFMFNSDANAICLYQGQELGLKNPKNLSISDIFNLDSKTEFQHIKNKASIESLMQGSCANARVPIPLDEYAFQESNPESVLANAIALVQKWKHR
jgi:glycosidase